MANSVLSAPQFHNEEAAFEYVEAHLWPNGPTCPHCGNADASKIGRLAGKTTRTGLRKCYACRKPFTVRVGTIFEDSHLGLRFWLQAIHLMCASKKGISTRQLQRVLGCGMKTAWHLGHRIRHAMAPGSIEPMGGAGKTIEIDETAVTNSRKTKRTAARKKPKMVVFALVDREAGHVRSMLAEKRIGHLIRDNIDMESRVVSDNAQYYKKVGFAKHETVDHSKYEWARGDVHTNNLEGFFSIFKRGLVGTYQHMDKKHVDRYLAEFDFRHNNRVALGIDDTQRASNALQGFKGKRLTYERTGATS
jgi:transposase-like protein